MSSGSPSKIYNILPNLTVEDYGTSMYHCSYKNNTIEYTDIYKYWFFNRENIKGEDRRTELLLELLEYLTHKDFFTMEHVDKVLLSIIHQELMKMHL